MTKKDKRRIARAAKACTKDEIRALAKHMKLTGELPVDRLPGIAFRLKAYKGMY